MSGREAARPADGWRVCEAALGSLDVAARAPVGQKGAWAERLAKSPAVIPRVERPTDAAGVVGVGHGAR